MWVYDCMHVITLFHYSQTDPGPQPTYRLDFLYPSTFTAPHHKQTTIWPTYIDIRRTSCQNFECLALRLDVAVFVVVRQCRKNMLFFVLEEGMLLLLICFSFRLEFGLGCWNCCWNERLGIVSHYVLRDHFLFLPLFAVLCFFSRVQKDGMVCFVKTRPFHFSPHFSEGILHVMSSTPCCSP